MKKSEINMITSAIKKRYPILPEIKEKMVTELYKKLAEPGLSARDIAAISKCLIAMENSNQQDEHLEAKNERLDAGLPTESTVINVEVPKPRGDITVK
jgi:hypothetical protein